jgi:hypothetical protein
MYNITLTTEQERQAKTELCVEEYCIRCGAPLPDASQRYLATVPYQTKKHLYRSCFIVCKTCLEDEKGTMRWFDKLEDWQVLEIAKDRSCFRITLR